MQCGEDGHLPFAKHVVNSAIDQRASALAS